MLAIIKLGGSVISNKAKPFSFRSDAAEIFAVKLSSLLEKGFRLVVVHGGGSFGHPVALRYRLHEGGSSGEKLRGFAETRYWMTELNQRLIRILLNRGVPAVAVQTSALAVTERGALSSFHLEPVRRLLEMGFVPVLFGDVVPDTVQGIAVLSGDAISAYLACELKANALVFVMGAGGVFSKAPGRPGATLLRELRSLRDVEVESARGADATGGVLTKLRHALEAARCGPRVAIGGLDYLIEMVLGVEGPYTKVVPSRT